MIQSKDAVIVHLEDMGAGANSRVQMDSMDGIALNPAPVRTVLIVMGKKVIAKKVDSNYYSLRS